MTAPLSDKAIAQAFREAQDMGGSYGDRYWFIANRAREIDAASHGEDEAAAKRMMAEDHGYPAENVDYQWETIGETAQAFYLRMARAALAVKGD